MQVAMTSKENLMNEDSLRYEVVMDKDLVIEGGL